MSLYSDLNDVLTPYAQRIKGKADKSTTYTKTEVDALISEVEVETDTTLEVSGAPADAAETGRQIGLINESLGVINLVKGYYINTSTTPINLTPAPSTVGRMYAVVNCFPGDKFVINAYSESPASRAWCFIDSTNNALSMADTQVTATNLELTAPANASKLIINDMTGGISYKVGNNLANEVYSQKGLSPEIVNVLLSCLYHTYSDDGFGTQYFNRLKRMLNTVMYHWKSTDPDAVIMNGLFDSHTIDGNVPAVKYVETNKRAVFGASHGEMPIFNSDGVTLSSYYPILIPEDAKTITITKTDSSFDIASPARRYSGKENEMQWIGDTGWKNDNIVTYPVPAHATRGRANIMWVLIKKTDNSVFNTMPVIDILFE